MYSNVRKKCRFGFSIVAALPSCLFARLEWISSISPFRYFVVTCPTLSKNTHKPLPFFSKKEKKNSPFRSAGQSSKDTDSRSPQTAPPIPMRPYTHLRRGEHAVNTPTPAYHRGTAANNTHQQTPISTLTLVLNLHSPHPPPLSSGSQSPTTDGSPRTPLDTDPAS